VKFNKYLAELLSTEVRISEPEIKALADLSHTTDAYIRETYSGDRYLMTIKFDGRDDREETVLLASTSKDEYKKLSKEFFNKFVEFGGSIGLEDVFTEKV